MNDSDDDAFKLSSTIAQSPSLAVSQEKKPFPIPAFPMIVSLSNPVKCMSLFERLLGSVLEILHLTLCLALCVLQALVVHVDAADLGGTDNEDEEVYGGKGNVLGADDEAPAGPDGASAHEGEVLGEGERFGGTGEVGGTGENHSPFHNGGRVERQTLVHVGANVQCTFCRCMF